MPCLLKTVFLTTSNSPVPEPGSVALLVCRELAVAAANSNKLCTDPVWHRHPRRNRRPIQPRQARRHRRDSRNPRHHGPRPPARPEIQPVKQLRKRSGLSANQQITTDLSGSFSGINFLRLSLHHCPYRIRSIKPSRLMGHLN